MPYESRRVTSGGWKVIVFFEPFFMTQVFLVSNVLDIFYQIMIVIIIIIITTTTTTTVVVVVVKIKFIACRTGQVDNVLPRGPHLRRHQLVYRKGPSDDDRLSSPIR